MKFRFMYIILISAACLTALSAGIPPLIARSVTTDCIHHGDVNFDGVITAADAQLAFQIVLAQYSPTWEEECAADCNGDGVVSAADAQTIFLAVIGTGECADPIPEPTATPQPTTTPLPTSTPTSGPSPTPTPTSPFITLLEKSNGLDVPSKEKGKTEYELADMNGNGYLDIVSVGDHGSPWFNSDQHGIMIWFGDGQGNWTVQQEGAFGYGGCAVGDLNNNGSMDIAWGVHHDYGSGGFGDRIMGAALGNGTGSGWVPWDDGLATGGETWGMFATDLADFNNNGLLDIVSLSFGGSNGVHVYQNHGDGTWSHVWAAAGGSVSYTLETGDFNADGNMDFIASRSVSGQNASTFFGDGNLNFTLNTAGLPQEHFRAVDVGDFNNNGADDILTATISGIRVFSFNSDTDQWEEFSNGLPELNTYRMVQFGDLNGNGYLDIVIYANPVGQIFLGDGQGNWTENTSFSFDSPGSFSALRVDGDFDHDGREDIIVQAAEHGFLVDINKLRAFSPWQEPAELSTRLVKPQGGETFTGGGVRFVRWLTAVPPAMEQARIDLFLSTTGPDGPWTPVAEDIPDNGRFQWTVPHVNSSECRLKIIATSGQHAHETMSSANFTIISALRNQPGQTCSDIDCEDIIFASSACALTCLP
jgi:hypothetical protein